MRVGVSKTDITPNEYYPLAGMHKTVTAKAVDVSLEVRCFHVDDGEHATLFIALDVLGIANQTVRRLREAIHARCHLPEDCPIMFACSHTHSAPLTTFFAGNSPNFDFLELLEDRIVSAVLAALASAKPARLSCSRAIASKRTFNRRPVYESTNGEQVGTHGPTNVDGFLRMESQPDEEIQILVARDDEGACLGGLVGFSCHPTLTGMDGVYSSDFCGSLVRNLDHKLGGTFAFLQGASGNLCAVHPDADMGSVSGMVAARELGHALAEIAIRSLSDETVLTKDARVVAASEMLPIPQRAVSREDLALARRYLENGPGQMTPQEVSRQTYGFDYGFYFDGADELEWFADETVGMWEWQQRSSIGPLVEVLEVWAVSIGDFAVAFFPVELFCDFGITVKKGSPFSQTMIATLSNGWHGYVPTEEAFSRGGYEPRIGFQSRLDPKAGAQLVRSAGALLESIHTTHAQGAN